MQIWYLSLLVFLLLFYDVYAFPFQFEFVFPLLKIHPFFIHLALDGVSLTLIILSAFLLPFCVLVSWQAITYRRKSFFFLLFFVTFLLFFVFSVMDLFFFYFFFEIILIPMFFLIGVWGSRERKIQAAYKFFIYTFVGSIFFLVAILFLYSKVGSTNFFVLASVTFIDPLFLTLERQVLVALGLMASFAVKIPLFPVHLMVAGGAC